MLIVKCTLLGSPGLLLLSKCIDENGDYLEKGVQNMQDQSSMQNWEENRNFHTFEYFTEHTFSSLQVRTHTIPILEKYSPE